MRYLHLKQAATFGVLLAVLFTTVTGRTVNRPDQTKTASYYLAQATPAYCVAEHNVGNHRVGVSNYGCLGDGYHDGPSVDCFTGEAIKWGEYPKGSNNVYLFGGALWLGAVVGGDTLVSVGFDGWIFSREMSPDESPSGDMIRRSTLDQDDPEYDGAVSEQDFVAVYTDTFTAGVPHMEPDEVDGRPHIPLNVEITQKSYAWSYAHTEDFVLLEYGIKNIGNIPLNEVYIGLFVDHDVLQEGTSGFYDDLDGFIQTTQIGGGPCSWTSEINLAWTADADGDPSSGVLQIPDVTGFRLIRSPAESPVAYNWWTGNTDPRRDYGPQHKTAVRDLGHGGTGTPSGDRNKYHYLSNGEVDYDRVFAAAIEPSDPVWTSPSTILANDLSNGWDCWHLLSVGPFDIDPGETMPVVMAYVGGRYFHVDPDNAEQNLWPNYNPAAYVDGLNFSDLVMNSNWASWVYDNPGVDTDLDGYSGEFVICEGDTVFTGGDGIPDYRAACAPEIPKRWLETGYERVHLRWNGLVSETTPDCFSGKIDFEGYNVYLSLEPTSASFARVGAYDVENYLKYVYLPYLGTWDLRDDPFTVEQLRCLYGTGCDDDSFDPAAFDIDHPYVHPMIPDSIFYFAPFGDNNSDLSGVAPISKTYPDQPYPSSLKPWLADPDELTEDGYFKYFEYEITISNLVSGQCYWVNVTATDHGQVLTGVSPLETSRAADALYGCVEGPSIVALDILPGECPNPMDIRLFYEMPEGEEEEPLSAWKSPGGELPVFEAAVLGSEHLDVTEINPSTLRLNGWTVIESVVEDVGRPAPAGTEECGCTVEGPDGYPDLVLTVRKPIAMLVPDGIGFGDQISLVLTGRFFSRWPFSGSDCIVITRSPSEPVTATPMLVGNYPNPFNPSTEISFYLPQTSDVRLDVYNIAGQVVATLVNGVMEAGGHTVRWDGTDLASGVYLYRIQAGDYTDSKKMLLLK